MKFEDYPAAMAPPRGVNPCAQCALRRLDAFLPPSGEELETIESFRVGARRVEAGSPIIDEHRPSPQLFTLYSGWAFRYKTLSDGRRQILSFLLPGDFLGLQDEFADGQTHGVEAVTDVTLCAFSRERLWGLFHAQPKLGYDITWLAAREEKMVDDNLVTAGRRNAGERVAMLLMHLYRRAQRVGMERDGWVEFPFSQQHIADALGLSLVHTNKTLRRLSMLGLHELKNGRLRLLNTRALARIAEYYDTPPRLMPLL